MLATLRFPDESRAQGNVGFSDEICTPAWNTFDHSLHYNPSPDPPSKDSGTNFVGTLMPRGKSSRTTISVEEVGSRISQLITRRWGFRAARQPHSDS
jgi:hypothetical protein